jgi:hypothetical protein
MAKPVAANMMASERMPISVKWFMVIGLDKRKTKQAPPPLPPVAGFFSALQTVAGRVAATLGIEHHTASGAT